MLLSGCRNSSTLNISKARSASILQCRPSWSYIKKKQLDQIEKQHGTSTMQKLKMYSKQAQLIYKQGWTALKEDYHTYVSLRQKQLSKDSVLSREEQRLKKRMWQEIHGLKNLIIIQILPFSGPLLIYYIYVYPTSIPSWFSVDELHEKYQKMCIETQINTIQYFQQNPLKTQSFTLWNLTSPELKKLSDLLFGHHQDGMTGYNKIMHPKRKEYLFHPWFSKYLLIRNIKKQFQQEKYHNPELKSKSIEELIIEKYERIMNGSERILFEPVHEGPLTQSIEEDSSNDKNGEKSKNMGQK